MTEARASMPTAITSSDLDLEDGWLVRRTPEDLAISLVPRAAPGNSENSIRQNWIRVPDFCI
ncbi:hypothetical protein [Streptomyces sp. NPDC002520]